MSAAATADAASSPVRRPLVVLSPVAGRAVPLAEVPDPVFAAALVGPGLAVDPARDRRLEAVAPITGTVVKLHPHAYVVRDDAGHGVLVHLGIDTVQLGGEGFDVLVGEGDAVAAGTPVIAWDPAAVAAGGRSPVCPVVALDAPPGVVADAADGDVAAGGPLFSWSR